MPRSLVKTLAAAIPATALLLFAFPHHTAAQAASAAPSPAQTTADPNDPADNAARHKLRNSIYKALWHSDFAALDALASEANSSHSRITGGDFTLQIIIGTLSTPRNPELDWDALIERLTRWSQANPQSIAARAALAHTYINWAWVARGHAFWEQVTPEGKQLFTQRLSLAQKVLEDAFRLDNSYAPLYTAQMAIAANLDWTPERSDRLFREAITGNRDFYPFYQHRAEALLPKWDGTPGATAKFTKDSADALGGDDGDLLYFEIAATLIRLGNGDFNPQQLDWTQIQRGHAVLDRRYGVARKDLNEMAFMAVRFNDAATARTEFAALGDHWDPGVWRTRQRYDKARSHILGTAG